MPQEFDTKQLEGYCLDRKISCKSFIAAYRQTYYPLIQKLLEKHTAKKTGKPLVIGMNAPQGAGKSTLCELFSRVISQEKQLNVICLSIDDFYKTHAERKTKAQLTHPLFITRGVPGTHDISLALDVFEKLLNLPVGASYLIPRFDKATDDRADESQWRTVNGALDIILFEGWCVGSRSQNFDQLESPVNTLEKTNDSDASWRKRVNVELGGNYQKLFSVIDYLIYLKAPSFKTVCRWRQEQEQKLIEQLIEKNQSTEKTLTSDELGKFMMYFERITRHNFQTLPKYADWIVEFDNDRRPKLVGE